jgi:hypothetical protein
MTTAGLPSCCMQPMICRVPGEPPIPEGEEHIARLGELRVPTHTSAFPEARPVRCNAARAHVMPHGPAKAEAVSAPGAAVQHLGDVVAFERQRVTQELIVGERACTGR